MKSTGSNSALCKICVLAAGMGISASVWADDPYVEFTGTQCVDTGYHVSGQTAIVADFQLTDTTTQQQLVWSAGTKLWHRFYVSSECTWSWSCLNWGTGDPAKEAKYDNSTTGLPVDGERTVATVDGFRNRVALEKNGSILFERQKDWTGWSNYPHTETSSESLKIGCRFAENRFYAKMKLYSFKVYEAGELVRDYVPAEQDGIVGLYDLKNGGFVYDTRMPLGGDHLLSSGGKLKKLNAAYVESVGNRTDVACGMNARMRAYGDVRIEVDFALQKIAEQDRIFGADGRPCLYASSANKWTFSCGRDAKTMIVEQAPDTNRHTVVVDYFTRKLELRNGPTVFWESEINSGFDPLESDTPMPFALFANMNSSSGSDGKGFRYRHQANARIYGARFYRAGKLVYDYRPCVKGGVAGFKDAVSGDFIFGENADAFTAGGDVERIGDDPYVQLTGNNANDGTKKWINTGYYPGPTSKIVLDYALADSYPGSGEWFLMSAWTPAAGDAAAERLNFEANKTSAVQWRNGTGTSFESVSDKLGTAATQRNVRRQICYDAEKGTCTLVTAGFTNVTATSAATLTRTMVDKTLRLGCNTDATPVNFAPLKIYGLKIWEGDTLVHDFSPCVSNGVIGLRDVVSGRFAADSQTTPKPLDAGGTISCDAWSRSAYLEFTGAQSFDTGIYPTSNTCVVADFQLTDLHNSPQQFVWSSDEFCHRLYTANGSVWAWFCFNNNLGGQYSSKAMDLGRFTATVDPCSEHVEFVREGARWYKYGGSWESLTRTATSTSTLKIGSRFAEGSSGWCFTSMKLYRFKIYEKGDLVRDYVPYREDGVLGLFDLVHKDFITDSLKTAEMKMGGVGEVVTPLQDVTIAANAEETLVCRASGAVGYRWYVNGEAVEGATGSTYTVTWRRGTPKTDVISVVPQYELFGVPTEGVASTAEITYGSRGCVILFR